MLFQDVYDDFVRYLEHERGVARATRECYISWLHHFIKWCDGEKIGDTFSERFNAPLLRRYLYYQNERGLRPRTVRGVFAPLRALGVFALDHKLVTEDSSRAFRLPKYDAAERPQIADADLLTLLAACERIADRRRSALARAMMSVLIYTGVRFAEFIAFKFTDLDLKARTLVVRHGKGEKARTLHLCDECYIAVSEWIVERSKIGAKTDWLWQYDTRRRMGEYGTRQLIQDIVFIAGLQDHPGAKPHSIRHAFATRLLRNGADLTAISASLGHQGLGTTWTYLHSTSEPTKSMQQFASLQLQEPPPQLSTPKPPGQAAKTPRVDAESGRLRDHMMRRRLPAAGSGGAK
ncbi:MAG: tyrosine-type recombinase/integrase [Akkermansiaceae bacterium]|nr:tyrosine-type recombinase/integrase [Armatimonadota bacterium]